MSAVPQTAGWQTGFLNFLPAVQTHAQIQFRHLPAEQREDAIQEAIASACVSYQLLAARGRLHVAHPGTLATFAVNFVRNGRHVGGSQNAATDVLSPIAHRRHGVVVGAYTVRSGDGTDDWKQIAVADRTVPIPDTVAFRVDFAEWLRSQGRRDRKIIAAFIRGERTRSVAGRFGITEGRVSQLRRKYERAWRLFQGEVA